MFYDVLKYVFAQSPSLTLIIGYTRASGGGSDASPTLMKVTVTKAIEKFGKSNLVNNSTNWNVFEK